MATLQELLREEAAGSPFEDVIAKLVDDADSPADIIERIKLSIQFATEQTSTEDISPHHRQLLRKQFQGVLVVLNALDRHVPMANYPKDQKDFFMSASPMLRTLLQLCLE